MVDEHDRAVAAAGDLAEHRRDRLDLLVGVLVDLVRLDERVDDEQADAVCADVLDAGVDVGQPHDGSGAVGLGDEQRTIGAAVERQPSLHFVEGDVPVLQDGGEPSLQLVAVVLVVVDPDLGLLVHLLAGDCPSRHHRHGTLEAERRLADAGGVRP